MVKFGEVLKEARLRRRATLRDLSVYSGKSISYLSDIEQGRRRPPKVEIVKKFEEFLGIKSGELVNVAKQERKTLKDIPAEIQKMIMSKPEQSFCWLRAAQDLSDKEMEKALEVIAEMRQKKR